MLTSYAENATIAAKNVPMEAAAVTVMLDTIKTLPIYARNVWLDAVNAPVEVVILVLLLGSNSRKV